jgi:acetyl esterase/lipase
MKRPHLTSALACLLLVATPAMASCSNDNRPAAAAQTVAPAAAGVDLHPDTTGSGQVPGALSAATSLPTVDRRLKSASALAARIEYTSTSGVTNALTRVSATVFVPKGKPPDGGWPVIAYGHGTAGSRPECAPSLSPTLLGSSVPVTALVRAGYVVTLPDYQGLGMNQTYHPFLDSTTAGYNVIDAVRATRHLVPETGDRWMAIGVSQGGQAAWAANELNRDYGNGLNLLGSVSLSPPTDITAFADLAETGGLTAEQQSALRAILEGLRHGYPDFRIDDYRHGVVAQNWDILNACAGPDLKKRADLATQVGPDDLKPSSPEAVDALRAHLQQMGLPQRPSSAPMLVIYGGKDDLVLPEWTDRALHAACGMGDVIDIQFQPDKGHSDLDVSLAFSWIADRFKDRPAPNSCEGLVASAQSEVSDGADASEIETEQATPVGGDEEGP